MKLTLRNLGRLREATIDLGKDLILLTGRNNTSKTYVAHAIYGFGSSFMQNFSSFMSSAMGEFIAGQSIETGLKIDLVQFMERYFSRFQEEMAGLYRGQLADVLAASEEFVARAEVKFGLSEEHLAEAKKALLNLNEEGKAFGWAVRKVSGDAIMTFERLQTASSSEPHATAEGTHHLGYVAGTVGFFLVLAFPSVSFSPHILTAERAAIQLFSRELSLKRTELVDELMQLKSRLERRPKAGEALLETLGQRARRYPQAIRDSLLLANDLGVYRKTTSPFAPLAERLERELLGGAIRIDEEGEVFFQPDSAEGGLSLHLSSSSVKSLAGLSFFLRHIAQQDHFLIIDEPELNLHPDNQRKVARVLGRLVRSGVKVMISTHSDYIIRELNNLIMLSADTDGALRRKHGYDEEETLKPSQVGAYLFDAERARPIEVAPTGIEVETIDREINALNTVSQDVYFSLFDKPRV